MGFNITCELSSYDYNVDQADIAAILQLAGCGGFSDLKTRNATLCNEILQKYDRLPVSAEGLWTFYAKGPPVKWNERDPLNTSFNSLAGPDTEINNDGLFVRTQVKTNPTCKGTGSIRRCDLRQGIVEYAVVLKHNTIALQHAHWQNDTFLQGTPAYLLDSRDSWTDIVALLYPPVVVEITSPAAYEPLRVKQYFNCNSNNRQPNMNTTCQASEFVGSQFALRDFSERYLDQSDDSKNPCGYTWRDPMQVCTSYHPRISLQHSFRSVCQLFCVPRLLCQMIACPTYPADHWAGYTR